MRARSEVVSTSPFHVVVDGSTVLVSVSVDIDIANHLDFAQAALLHIDEAERFILDLTGVSFIDMRGCGIVARIAKDLRRRDVPLHVAAGSRVHRILNLGGLLPPAGVYSTLHGALIGAHHQYRDHPVISQWALEAPIKHKYRSRRASRRG